MLLFETSGRTRRRMPQDLNPPHWLVRTTESNLLNICQGQNCWAPTVKVGWTEILCAKFWVAIILGFPDYFTNAMQHNRIAMLYPHCLTCWTEVRLWIATDLSHKYHRPVGVFAPTLYCHDGYGLTSLFLQYRQCSVLSSSALSRPAHITILCKCSLSGFRRERPWLFEQVQRRSTL